MFDIQAIPAYADNYIWLITFGDREAAIIDPGDASPVIKTIEKQNLKPSAILITHHHWDHVDGIEELVNKYPVTVYGPATEQIPCIHQPLTEGSHVQLGDHTLRVLDTPGHTSGHIVYHDEKHLFCGDTLFAAGCGRVPPGNSPIMFESLNKIKKLPKSTYVYCTHEYTLANLRFALAVEPDNEAIQQRQIAESNKRNRGLATIPSMLEQEFKTNPFLRCHIAGVVKAAEEFSGKPLNSEVDVFTVLRYWKDTFV